MASENPLHVSEEFGRDLAATVRDYKTRTRGSLDGEQRGGGDRRQIIVILNEDVGTAGTVMAERQIPGSPTTELRIVRDDPLGLPGGFFRTGDRSGRVTYRSTAEEFEEATGIAVTGGRWDGNMANVVGRRQTANPNFGLNLSSIQRGPGRWKLVESDMSIEVDDEEMFGGRVLKTRTRLNGTGDWYLISYTHASPQRLIAGTQCVCELIPGQGWTVISWDEQPRAPEAPPNVTEPIRIPCGTQTQIFGAQHGNLCGENSPDLIFLSGANAISRAFSAVAFSGPRVMAHDSGNVWRSDSFPKPGPGEEPGEPENENGEESESEEMEGPLHWRLEVYQTDHGLAAKLELVDEEEELYLLYLSSRPWDCLGAGQLTRISHASRGTPELPVHKWSYCVIATPRPPTCDFPVTFMGSARQMVGRCGPYVLTGLGGRLLMAGPPQMSQFEIGEGNVIQRCSYPPLDADGSPQLSVVYEFGRFPVGLELIEQLWLRASVGGVEFESLLAVNHVDVGCRHSVQMVGGPVADMPNELQIEHFSSLLSHHF